MKALFSQRGRDVLISELLWVWAPVSLLLLFLKRSEIKKW
jgi:hypothetical protein